MTLPVDLVGTDGSTWFLPFDPNTIEIADPTLDPAYPSTPIDLVPLGGYLSVRREGARLVGGLFLSLSGTNPEGTLVSVGGPFDIVVP